jgi:hypothetical protein
MKHLKLHNILQDARWVYLEGRVGEVNPSVKEWVEQQKKGSAENSDTERLQQAKQFAMSKVPTLAGRTMDDIARHFWRPGLIENAKSTANLEKAVRNRVLDTLKQAPATTAMPSWGGNYLKVINDIEKDEDKAILTLEDTDRALQSVRQLKTKYERQANILIERKKELDRVRYGVGNLFKLANNKLIPGFLIGRSEYDRKENTAEQYRFSKGNEVALGVFQALEQKIQAKKERASEVFADNKNHVEESFNGLSPDQKDDFMVFVKNEIAGTNTLDTADDWAKQVVFGLNFQQRIEVFKALNLDPSNALKALDKNRDLFDNIEDELQQRRGKLESQVKGITNDNIQALKRSLKGYKADSSFDPSSSEGVKAFVTEIGNYLDQEGDLAPTSIFSGYPKGEQLNDTEKMVVFLNTLINNKDVLVKDKMAKPLKAKLLTYLNFLENVDAQDESEIEGQTEEFLKQRDIIRDRLEAGKTLVESTLDSVANVQDINRASILEIDTFVGLAKREIKIFEDLKNRSAKLSGEEIKTLDKLFKEVEFLIKQFEELKAIWHKESRTHQLNLKEAQEKEIEAKAELDRNKRELDKANKDRSAEAKKAGLSKTAKTNAQNRLKTAQANKAKIERAYSLLKPKSTKGSLTDDEVIEFSKLGLKLDEVAENYQDAKSEVESHKTTVEEAVTKLEALDTVVRKAEESYLNATSKHNEAKTKKTELEAIPTGTEIDFNFTSAKQHFAESLSTLSEDLADLAKFNKKGETSSSSLQVQRYLLELSALQNNQQHQARLEQVQTETLATLMTMPKGVRVRQIHFVQYMHGRKMTSDTSLTRPKSDMRNMSVLDHTDDAVILYQHGGSNLAVIQKSSDGKKVEVLEFAAPTDFDPSKNVPLSYIPEKADRIGELTTINP